MTLHKPDSPSVNDLPIRLHDAHDLLGIDGRAAIVLNETLYILRLTRSGELVLTQ